ncbi:MAG: cytochrome c oxidase subunit 3 [Gammaproteobacteria bacterium]|nr:cytochrome c oxidase subunit 3 [Gammaproteobacteria bacterium]
MSSSHGHYYVPDGSRWPIIAVLGMFSTLLGTAFWINGLGLGPWLTALGLVGILYLFFGWFGEVIDESMSGKYNAQVDTSFRQGMMWFISSEAFFFVAFFGSLYYIRMIAVPWLDGEGHLGSSHLLWDSFSATWPLVSTPDVEKYTQVVEPMGAGGIPMINTLLLLSSGVTLTWAHWGLKKDSRFQLVFGLILTVVLGVIFMGFQAYEYYHAYDALGLTLNSGVYGSTFYMLTGFHGMHVTIGAIMLTVITVRAAKGHFSHEKHFAFEAVAWYWHFVDVVWLGLYVFVYWL